MISDKYWRKIKNKLVDDRYRGWTITFVDCPAGLFAPFIIPMFFGSNRLAIIFHFFVLSQCGNGKNVWHTHTHTSVVCDSIQRIHAFVRSVPLQPNCRMKNRFASAIDLENLNHFHRGKITNSFVSH